MKPQWQRGSLTKSKGKLYAQWREGGRHRKKLLGPASMRKTDARAMLAEFVRRASETIAHDPKLSDFISDTYLRFYLRKWKDSTYDTVAGHMRDYVLPALGQHKLSWFTRDKLQNFLDDLGELGLSHNLINHVRWDLSQIFELARSEGSMPTNPLRRTHATLMRENKVDPKVVADQLGHGLNVDLNVYTQTSLKQKSEAVDKLERSGRVM